MAEHLHIRANFERLVEREDLRDWETRGVYVNLGGNPVKTCRVGEGWVDARAAASWRGRNERMIACDLGAREASKRDAQILEWLLLEEYRYRKGKLPGRNLKSGNSSLVSRVLSRRTKIKVTIRGISPMSGRRLSSPYHSEIGIDDDGGFFWYWE